MPFWDEQNGGFNSIWLWHSKLVKQAKQNAMCFNNVIFWLNPNGKKQKKTNNVPANADRLYQFHEALVFVSWYRLTSYVLLRVLACSSFNRVSPPFQRRSSRHAGTAEQSAAYVLVTEASCFAQSAPSLPTTSCLGAAMLQQCQLSTSPRARHITGKSVCLSAKISACSWIYECVWNGFWCLCVHLCPCQKGLPDVWL